MVLLGIKVFVGIFLMGNFSLPLVVLATNRRLLDEPIHLLVLNLMLTFYGFGASFFLIGMADVLYPDGVPSAVCASAMYLSMGVAIGVKSAMLLLATDQYIAMVHSLRYYAIMDVWKWRMVPITWCCMPLMWLFFLTCYQLDLETSDEFAQRLFGVQPSNDECRLAQMAHVANVVLEVLLLVASLSTAVMFIYTAMQGFKQEKRIIRSNTVDVSSRFLLRFKSFKRIVKLLLILLALDIIGTVFRLVRIWVPRIAAMHVMHLLRVLSIVFEGWTHGLSSPAFRDVIRRFFGCRKRKAAVQELPGPSAQRQPSVGEAWPPASQERF